MKSIIGGLLVFSIWATASGILYQRWFAGADLAPAVAALPENLPSEQSSFVPSKARTSKLKSRSVPGMLSIYEEGEVLFSAKETIQGEPGSESINIGTEASRLLGDLADYLIQQDRAALVITRRQPGEGRTPDGTDLALARGDSVRKILVAAGVSPERVSLVAQTDELAFEQKNGLIDFVVVEEDRLIEFITEESGLPSQDSQAKLETGDTTISLSVNKPSQLSFSLTRQIQFDYGTAVPKEDPAVDNYLKQLAEYLNQEPSRSVEIIGHTCNISSTSFNQQLALERASSVMDLLIQSGVSASRMRANSAGETQPIADNGTEDGQQANRRVEIIIR
jgi:outer membrane protein OmpA-like peptidoglycan-associated protein